MTSALLRLVIRTKLPACHVPLMLLFATSTHALTEAPPLLPTLTEMARWNDAGGTIVGSASVLLVMWADTLIDDPAAELNKSMPRLFTSRMSFPLTVVLNAPPVPGKRPRPAQLFAHPEPTTPALPMWLPMNEPLRCAEPVVLAPLTVTA